MSSFYTLEELDKINFRALGTNVKISRHASIYSPQTISLGNNIRIDDFTLLSGDITIGNNVHIASHSGVWGAGTVVIEDFANISSGVKIYSQSDDFSGKTLTNPTIPDSYKTNMIIKPVRICRHAIIGANSVILPGVTLNIGCAIGAGSVVKYHCNPWTMYAGAIAKEIGIRSDELLIQEAHYLANQ